MAARKNYLRIPQSIELIITAISLQYDCMIEIDGKLQAGEKHRKMCEFHVIKS